MANKLLAIVGRPNVGKSTLFNRLTHTRSAIVDEVSGVTRDRHYGTCQWEDYKCSVVDTGGYVHGSDDVFEAEIRKQVQFAIDEADLILFVVDVTTGITDLDQEIARMLHRQKKPVILVVNKVDNDKRVNDAYEFYALDFDDMFMISAVNDVGVYDMMERVFEILGKHPVGEAEETLPRFAVVGRPNVGKSSFINALIGEDRHIVTPIAGTTRDSIDTVYNKYGMKFMLVDTAGMRRKSQVKDDVEFYSVMRTIHTIERADVVFLMIDATEGNITSQDLNIFRLIQKNHKGIVLLVNKWDLIKKDTNTHNQFRKNIHERIAPFTDVPILFISALHKQRIYNALQTALKVYDNRKRRLKTSELNETLLPIIEQTPPPAHHGKYIKIKYITQLPRPYPAFAFFANHPEHIKEAYRRFLENRIREKWDFHGVPIEILFKKK